MSWHLFAAALLGGVVASTLTVGLMALLAVAGRADDDRDLIEETRECNG